MAVARADRGAFVIGGAEYFREFRKAVISAKRSVRILGWDFHSKIEMLRDDDDGWPKKLGDFLVEALRKNPDLEIHVLIWDFSMIYAAEREWTELFGWEGSNEERMHFRTDDQLPVSASHHQKVVVVDGKLGFVGGIDLAAWRWDKVKHPGEDTRRKDPWGKQYGPYHDLQMVVAGEAAGVLGQVFQDRWKRATGETLGDGRSDGDVPWPEGLEVDFRDTELGFARTSSSYENYPAVREIEELHLRIIREAKRYLYIENQYVSCHTIAEALCERLRENEGPEVVIVIPAWIDTWKEENTIGLIRDRLIELLREADEHGRLRVLYPRAPKSDGEEVLVYVHAKLIIADDRIVKVGSSNLTNRSMGIDSELDAVIAEEEESSYAAKLLHRLLGVHHHTALEKVEEAAKNALGLIALVDGLRSEDRHSLVPVPESDLNLLQKKLADSKLLDPEDPVDPSQWLQMETPDEFVNVTKKRILVIALSILALVTLTILFQKFLGDYVDKETATSYFKTIQESLWSPGILMLVFLLASVTGVSLNVLLVAAALVFNPWMVFGTAVIGAHAGANVAFLAGKLWGQKLVKRFGGDRVAGLSRKLGERGVFSVALLRLLPIAPFPVVNVVAGSSHMSARIFNLGSILGMAPGMFVVVLLAELTKDAVREPNAVNVVSLLVLVLFFLGAVVFARRAIRKRGKGRKRE